MYNTIHNTTLDTILIGKDSMTVISFIITTIVTKRQRYIHHRLIQLLGCVVVIVLMSSPVAKMGGKASETNILKKLCILYVYGTLLESFQMRGNVH